HVIHGLNLHLGDALHLRPGGLDNLLGPAQRPCRRGHLLDHPLAVLLAAVDRLCTPGRHRVERGVDCLARLLRKPGGRHRIETAGARLGELVRHGTSPLVDCQNPPWEAWPTKEASICWTHPKRYNATSAQIVADLRQCPDSAARPTRL